MGKAKNLKNRLLSYTNAQLLPKTAKLVQTADATKVYPLKTELDALLVEASLIKTFRPKYNSRLKDGKSYLYIAISADSYPNVFPTRKPPTSTFPHNYFGPYPSSKAVKQLLKFLRKVYPWCSQPDSGAACFYYHLGLCPGACINQVSPQEYQRNIDAIRSILDASTGDAAHWLRQHLQKAVDRQQFEVAATLKYQLDHITRSQFISPAEQLEPNISIDIQNESLKQAITLLHSLGIRIKKLSRLECFDISNIGDVHATGSMVVLSQGQPDPSQYRRFRIKTVASQNDFAMLTEVLRRRFSHSGWRQPDIVLLDGGPPQLRYVTDHIDPHSLPPLIGIAKKPDRLVSGIDPTLQIVLDPSIPAHRLFIIARDEAHRFANKYQQHLHKKKLITDE